jgi:hypothetical protein
VKEISFAQGISSYNGLTRRSQIMKTRAVQKVKALKASQRRCLEHLLGRPLAEDEEIAVVATAGRSTTADGHSASCYEVAKKARVIGMIKNAPRDLSTNKKYLEGLGGR